MYPCTVVSMIHELGGRASLCSGFPGRRGMQQTTEKKMNEQPECDTPHRTPHSRETETTCQQCVHHILQCINYTDTATRIHTTDTQTHKPKGGKATATARKNLKKQRRTRKPNTPSQTTPHHTTRPVNTPVQHTYTHLCMPSPLDDTHASHHTTQRTKGDATWRVGVF